MIQYSNYGSSFIIYGDVTKKIQKYFKEYKAIWNSKIQKDNFKGAWIFPIEKRDQILGTLEPLIDRYNREEKHPMDEEDIEEGFGIEL